MEGAEGERKMKEGRREERREERSFKMCKTLAMWIVIFMAPNLCREICNYDNCRHKRREVRTDILCMQPSLVSFPVED